MLLVDEIDRADDEFEAFLLEVLTDHAVTIPELGEIRAEEPPLVVLTSNRTREVHDALKRRCLYHWLDAPRLRPRGRDPAPPAAGGDRAAGRAGRRGGARLREADLLKPPGVAETLDWAARPAAAGRQSPRRRTARPPRLGAVLKYREDAG